MWNCNSTYSAFLVSVSFKPSQTYHPTESAAFTANSMLLDLAPELQIQIMQFCSPDALSSLSGVQSSLRDIAEHLLYSHVYFYAQPLELIQNWKSKSREWALKENRSLLHTLITNPRKAGMMKTLCVEFETFFFCSKYSFETLKALHTFLVKLSEALRYLPNLVDLRIMHDKTTFDISEGSLSQAIRFVLRFGYRSCHYLMVIVQGRLLQTPYTMPRLLS